MDNKITKKRLGVLFSYDWIYLIGIIILSCFGMSFIYGFLSIKPVSGQVFNYYYDYEVSSTADESFAYLYRNIFSYDVRSVEKTALTQQEAENILTAKLENGEGNVIFTHINGKTTEQGYYQCRAHDIIDYRSAYPIDDEKGGVLYELKEYLSKFLIEQGNDPLDYNNLSEQKIADNFNNRTAKNRIYKNDLRKGLICVEDEYERIKSLCEEAKFFQKVLQYDKTLPTQDSIFYRYVKYTQASFEGDKMNLEAYKELLSEQTERPYALKLNVLNGGKNVSDYFKMKDANLKSGVVMILFDLSSKNTDLMFESVTFFNMVIRNFSDIAEKIN